VKISRISPPPEKPQAVFFGIFAKNRLALALLRNF
jgi:hypothetical protein